MKKIYLLLALSFFGAKSFAQTTYTTADFGSWDDPSHWVGGVVPPNTIGETDVVNINHNTFITSKTIINNGIINVGAYTLYEGTSNITNNGKVIVAESGTLYTIDETSSITNNYAIDNNGTIYNVNVLMNDGYIFNQGNIYNFQRLFYDGTAMQCSDWGTLVNNNVLCNSDGGVVSNDCTSTTTGNSETTNCTELKATVMNATLATLGSNKFLAETIKVYPNPTQDKITIDFNNVYATNSTIEIFDVTGKSILKNQLTSASAELNISSFANGVYVLKITNPNQQQIIKKIVKN